ncbi:long-chain-fatty-acid--CoA ligase [Natranaerofaba carboxydovora]|uniref:long-chain-fatty-acid--CoA ligase n=1 Tax=Natranaerofaba carboxydovora TaxID=2742683 RepID=UPI001F1390A5|nr:long-chain-fatty-acid--CoA ligase [Natranaerofaba carboxydovora]UMZ74240.1 Long-chain-fatty-acid--CoA ligase [Natranaerofaba carboxydovora]
MYKVQSVKTLAEILPKSSEYFENKTALYINNSAYTYNDLDRLSNSMASKLVDLGISKGDRVSIYFGNSVEWIISYYAAAKIGAIINPINVMLTPEEVAFVVNDNQAKVLIISEEKEESILNVKNQFRSVEIIISTGNPSYSDVLSFSKLLEEGDVNFQYEEIAPEDISTICYTSGTTGHPKGASLTHKGVILNSAMTANMHVRTEHDCIVSALPTAHVYGNVVMNSTFMVGGTLVLLDRFEERRALENIEKHKATMFEGVPTMYLYLLNYPEFNKYDVSSLEKCTVGGQIMGESKAKEVEEKFDCPLLELWGMTEISGLGTTHPLYGYNKHGSIGIPLPYCECKIVSAENPQKTLSSGEVGELMIKGPILMKEYWGNNKATSETINQDGWLHTGDVGYIDEEGYIFIVDRKKDMIIAGGYNIYPSEIERVLSQHPKVAIAAIGKMTDELKGELPKAFIVLKQGEKMEEDEVISYCREYLAPYKIPRSVAFVDDVPKTSTGKIMRRELSS